MGPLGDPIARVIAAAPNTTLTLNWRALLFTSGDHRQRDSSKTPGQQAEFFTQVVERLRPGSSDTLRYMRDRAEDITRSRGAIASLLNGADGVPGTADDFDAFLAAGNNLAGTPAKAGYPSIVVPGGARTHRRDLRR